MSIPDKAVEAAAENQYSYDWGNGWQHSDEVVKDRYRESARSALEAAEPYLTGKSYETLHGQDPDWVNGDVVRWRPRKESTESIVYVMVQGYWVETNRGIRYPVSSLGISWADGRLEILHKQEVKS